MDVNLLKDLLKKLKDGTIEIDEAIQKLKFLPFEDIGFASIDHHRHLRRGFPEVIYARGKRVEEIIAIIEKMADKEENILITRLADNKAKSIKKHFPSSDYYPKSRILTIEVKPIEKRGKGTILVITAGTSDIPVAEEATVTATFMGNDVKSLFDVGVAGLHRLLQNKDTIMKASVIVVVAGMEGALPSIVGGLVDKPVIAVPTSTGYGASFRGLSALLGMLNSCAAGVTVVNIDNGFGAGYAASLINRL
ncbi:MAG: nickel pincer cofactor biosynthesis protein LarB [Deltaproteobacteria bacterium]|jgi:NCAIR mutase (PurE)-related protein|nr:nickel pincer cofactor biosynthesis protein LarB [Deltaproteobacteria bacterium]